jgi:pyrroline-5-carboxylate reductase
MRTFVQSLFEAVGVFRWLDDEVLFHPATALVGSVPAFMFVAMKALVEAGVSQGLPPVVARDLAIATVEGSAGLADTQTASFDELRLSVSSPGGTTVAGLGVLEERDFESTIIDAIRAAAVRSAELAREAGTR